MSDFKIVTISNREPQEPYYTYKYLQKSAGDNEILVLGQSFGEYTGLSDKPRILYNSIKDGLIKEDIIVFVDAWDVVFASELDEVIDKFHAINCPIVIGAEQNCFPAYFKKEYDNLPSQSSFKYLNSGVIVGYKDAIMEVLEAMDAPNLPVDYHNPSKGNYHFNDQAYYMGLFLRQPVKMKLDYECLIAQNMQDVEPEEIYLANGRVMNVETTSEPCIIHWNGSSKDKWSREPILKHLNLL